MKYTNNSELHSDDMNDSDLPKCAYKTRVRETKTYNYNESECTCTTRVTRTKIYDNGMRVRSTQVSKPHVVDQNNPEYKKLKTAKLTITSIYEDNGGAKNG